MSKIFISYKRQDKDIVFPIVEEIKQKTGVDCWIDLEGIESGDQFQNVIIDTIDNADIVIFMLSKNFIAPFKDEKTGKIDLKKQTFPEKEVMYALRHNKRLIPISIDGTTVYDCKWLDFNCSGLNCIDWVITEEKDKFLKNLTDWSSKKICIMGEFSSGKTTIAMIINNYYKKCGRLINSTLSYDRRHKFTSFSISDFDLLGNSLTIMHNGYEIKVYDISLLPHISDFPTLISEIDGVIYVKNLNHWEVTQNDKLRIDECYNQNKTFVFVLTHCDACDMTLIKKLVEKDLTDNGIKKEDIVYSGIDNENFIIFFEKMISSICYE